MKKNAVRRFGSLLLIAALAILVLLFTGCEKLVSVSTIEMKEGQEEISTEIGRFDYSDYSIVIVYEDGTRVEEPLKEEYIPVEDRFALYSEGTHEITVRAHMRECKFTLHVGRHTFPESIRLCPPAGATENDSCYFVTYTGSAHSVTVDGPLPAGTKVTYSYGNNFTEVRNGGEPYECRAILTCEGYVTKELSCRLAITPATYDMSRVTFDDVSAVYDGKTKSVEITGELPRGLSVSYRIGEEIGNSAVNAGEYTVTAVFSGDVRNYLPVDPMTAVLTIEKKTVSASEYGAQFLSAVEDHPAVYDGEAHTPFTVSRLPSGVESAEIACYDASGKKVETIVNAGKYRLTLTLKPTDSANAHLDCETYEATYTVEPKYVDSAAIYFDNSDVRYDGKPHTLVASGEGVLGLGVDYSVEGCEEGELSFTDVGTYRFTAVIRENPNYRFEQVKKEATLTILKISSEFDPESAEKTQTFVYDGRKHTLKNPKIPEGLAFTVSVDGRELSADEMPFEVSAAGEYCFRFTFPEYKNYTDLSEYYEYTLVIEPAEMTVPKECYADLTCVYEEEEGVAKEHPFLAEDLPEGVSLAVKYHETADENTPPSESGDYEVTLTFSRENYKPVVVTAHIHIRMLVVTDLGFAAEFANKDNSSATYNGHPFFESEIIAVSPDRSEENFYCKDASSIKVKVTYTVVDNQTGETVAAAITPGNYRISVTYELLTDDAEVNLKSYSIRKTAKEISFTVTKADLKLKQGEHFDFGYRSGSDLLVTVSETGKTFGFENFELNLKEAYEDTVSVTGISLVSETQTSIKEAGIYKIRPTFVSDLYNVTADDLTFEVTPVDLESVAFSATFMKTAFPNKTDFLEAQNTTMGDPEGWKTAKEIVISFGGQQVGNLMFFCNTHEVRWDNMPSTLSVTFELYQAQNDKWTRADADGDGVREDDEPLELMGYPFWSGNYYIRFTLSNGESTKTFYEIPETPNYSEDLKNPDILCCKIS